MITAPTRSRYYDCYTGSSYFKYLDARRLVWRTLPIVSTPHSPASIGKKEALSKIAKVIRLGRCKLTTKTVERTIPPFGDNTRAGSFICLLKSAYTKRFSWRSMNIFTFYTLHFVKKVESNIPIDCLADLKIKIFGKLYKTF